MKKISAQKELLKELNQSTFPDYTPNDSKLLSNKTGDLLVKYYIKYKNIKKKYDALKLKILELD